MQPFYYHFKWQESIPVPETYKVIPLSLQAA